jgi:hypothetical protein
MEVQKKKTLKQKSTTDERKYTDERVADNLSLRKKKREQRLGDSRGYISSSSSSSAKGGENEFTRLAKENLKAACGHAFERIGQTHNPEAVWVGLRQLKHVVDTDRACYPAYPEVHDILPAKLVMDRLCGLMKTAAPELQEHVKEASECIAHIVQARKAGDLEHKWSNAVVHSGLIPVMSRHILENPNLEIRKQMLYSAIHFARRSYQNAKDAALGPTMLKFLAQKIPVLYEFVAWYICEMCAIKPALPWNDAYVGDELWAFARAILKSSDDRTMVSDIVSAVVKCYTRGNNERISYATCEEVKSFF